MPAGGREQRAHDVGEQMRRVDPRPEAVRSSLVRAHRTQLEPRPRPPQQQLADEGDGGGGDERDRNPADARLDRAVTPGRKKPSGCGRRSSEMPWMTV